MMTPMLRILLVLGSVALFLLVVRKIRHSQIRLEDSLFWIVFAFLLVIAAVFPQIFDLLAALCGVYSTANFIFMFFIFILLVKCFTMTVRISQQDIREKELAQYLAIEKFERKKNDGGIESGVKSEKNETAKSIGGNNE